MALQGEHKGLMLGLGLGLGLQVFQHLMAQRGFYVPGFNRPGESFFEGLSLYFLASCAVSGWMIGLLKRMKQEARDGAREAMAELAERKRKLEELNKKP